ncbi:MAG TPA: rRNA maturation RNase YbeY [Bryobacteraceae bacterium]|jgi:probable rRNA maturation factor
MSASEGSTVTFSSRQTEVRAGNLLRFAHKLQAQVARGRAFDCLITGDAHMRRLNREFRGKDSTTDVLSFPAGDIQTRTRTTGDKNRSPIPPRAGDIAISLARARSQARRFGHSTEQEIRILMLHGLLHLLGEDHSSGGGRMAHAEKRWRVRLGLPAGLIERVRP